MPHIELNHKCILRNMIVKTQSWSENATEHAILRCPVDELGQVQLGFPIHTQYSVEGQIGKQCSLAFPNHHLLDYSCWSQNPTKYLVSSCLCCTIVPCNMQVLLMRRKDDERDKGGEEDVCVKVLAECRRRGLLLGAAVDHGQLQDPSTTTRPTPSSPFCTFICIYICVAICTFLYLYLHLYQFHKIQVKVCTDNYICTYLYLNLFIDLKLHLNFYLFLNLYLYLYLQNIP